MDQKAHLAHKSPITQNEEYLLWEVEEHCLKRKWELRINNCETKNDAKSQLHTQFKEPVEEGRGAQKYYSENRHNLGLISVKTGHLLTH